jgi:hypothetical protein
MGQVPAEAPPLATTSTHQGGVVTQLPGSLVGQEGKHRIHRRSSACN